jgi:hypothetical protein
MNAYREWMYRSTHFLDLGTSWRRVVNFTPRPYYPRGKSTGTHWTGGWVDLRAGLDDLEKRKFFTLQDSNSDPSVVPTPLNNT